jgi:hypothetical protein
MALSSGKKGGKNAWATVDGGVVYVAKRDSDKGTPSTPFGFPLPEALMGDSGALAHFVASCLMKRGVMKGEVSLLFGGEVAFYEEYEVNAASARLRDEQRNIAIEKALGDAAASYIIEDARISEKDGLTTLAVCGVKYSFLSEFVKTLKRRGYKVDYASYAAPGVPPGALPDFTYGGRENRRFGRVTTVLCACAVAVTALLTLFPPVQAILAESDASRHAVELKSAEHGSYYELLEQYREAQRLLPDVRGAVRTLENDRTAYGGLLASLRDGLLSGGVVNSVQSEGEEGLTIEYTTGDIASFEEEKQLVNATRMMSVGEVGERQRVGADNEAKWRITLRVAYFSFDGGGNAYR